MGTLRKLAHLREQLGEKRFEDLINPENTGKVKRFCDKLFRDSLPQEMTVGDRTYEILGFHEEGERSVDGQTVVRRVSEIDANPNKEAGEHLLKHQHQIPVELRGNTFVFTNWRRDYANPGDICTIHWNGKHWMRQWQWIGYQFRNISRILRLKQEEDALPTEMTVGDRTYEIINFLEDSEESVRGEAMVARATIGYAHLGEKHGRHLLEHQDEIPIVLRDRVVFVFTDWRNPDHNKLVSCVYWHADHWRQRWDNLDNNFHSTDRILRLKKG